MHLRDGRSLVGVLRSYDQYGESHPSTYIPGTLADELWTMGTIANLVLTQTIERLFHVPSKSYAQVDRGVFLIRGENVVLLGEIVRPSLSPSLENTNADVGGVGSGSGRCSVAGFVITVVDCRFGIGGEGEEGGGQGDEE